MAFIRERQAQVLSDAIGQLSQCSVADLPSVVHAACGNVGSYQLDEAFAELTDLARVVNDPASPPDLIESTRARVVASLKSRDMEVGS